jgi:hypothetical protein
LPSGDQVSSLRADAGAVLASGLIWLAAGLLNKHLMSSTTLTTGIELIYLPAGFRLLIILLFGVWGALGIFLTNPLLFLAQFGPASALEIGVNAAISAFVPLLVINLCGRFCGIDASLLRLRAIHLPILALAVSVATPLMFNIQFSVMGLTAPGEFLRNAAAMSLGDFTGCLLVIASARLLIAAYRALS